MGDGTVYGWYRRGVPIQHTVLIGLALFIFGRVTSPQAQFERTLDSRGRPVPVRELELQRLAGGGGVGAGDGAGDASVQQGEQLRQRASVAESVYHESEGKARQQASAKKAPAVASSHVPPGREFVTHATGGARPDATLCPRPLSYAASARQKVRLACCLSFGCRCPRPAPPKFSLPLFVIQSVVDE